MADPSSAPLTFAPLLDERTALARNIVNQILDESGAGVEKRQSINDDCDAFVVRMLEQHEEQILRHLAMEVSLDTFWSRVNIGAPDECWEWAGFRHALGYGQFGIGRVQYRAHRVVLALELGYMPPSDMYACHRCDNPPCCNPAHLFLGAAQDNVRDMVEKGRCRAGSRQTEKTHCKHGHPFDEKNTYVEQREKSQVRRCRECHRLRQLARRARKAAALTEESTDA